MQPPPSDYYTYPKAVPESTCDINLKRARVVDAQGNSYIRMTGATTSTDLTPITDALGQTTDPAWDGQDASATIISLLKTISDKAGQTDITLNQLQGGNKVALSGFTYASSSTTVTIAYNEACVTVYESSNRLIVGIHRVMSGMSGSVSISSGSYYKIYAPGVDVGMLYLVDKDHNLELCSPNSVATSSNIASGGVIWLMPYDLSSIVS